MTGPGPVRSYAGPLRSYAGPPMTRPAEDPLPPAVVADRLEDATVLVAQGRAVVLVVLPGAAPDAQAALADLAGPGRVALFVGDPASPADRAVAEAMAHELFGQVGGRALRTR